jgi:hypothetical protein
MTEEQWQRILGWIDSFFYQPKGSVMSVKIESGHAVVEINHGSRVARYEIVEDREPYYWIRNMQTGAKFRLSKNTLKLVEAT